MIEFEKNCHDFDEVEELDGDAKIFVEEHGHVHKVPASAIGGNSGKVVELYYKNKYVFVDRDCTAYISMEKAIELFYKENANIIIYPLDNAGNFTYNYVSGDPYVRFNKVIGMDIGGNGGEPDFRVNFLIPYYSSPNDGGDRSIKAQTISLHNTFANPDCYEFKVWMNGINI